MNATHYVRTGLNLSDTRFYWLRAQDTSGNLSTYLGPGSATTNPVDAADLTGKIIGAQIDHATITGANLADDIIDISKIAGGYGLPAFWTGAALPGPANALSFNGSIILWSHDGRLYRYSNLTSSWTLAVDGGDLSAGSIGANTIAAGSITTALLAAGAVTASKLFVGDTTNLINDPLFQDQSTYWSEADAIGTVTSFNVGSVVTGTLLAPAAAAFNLGNIPAGDSHTFLISTPDIQIDEKLLYRARIKAFATSSANKNLFLRFLFKDADGAAVSSIVSPALTPAAFNPVADYEYQVTAPDGAVTVQISFRVLGGSPDGSAGAGSFYVAKPRFERLSTGTLIQDGAITTDHITAAGINGNAITAGTVTGDRIDANFIDSNVFSTVHNTGQPFIEISGSPHTVTSHMNAPWLRVNDGTFNRVIIGQLQDAWGIWIRDASNRLIFEEAGLGDGVVSTGNVIQGAIVGAATANVADGPFGNGGWQTAGSLSVTLYDNAITYFDATILLGYASGPQTWAVRLKVDGAVKQTIQTGVPNIEVSVGLSWSGSLSGSSAGVTHTAVLEWNAPNNVQIDGGTLTAIGMQR